MSPDELYNIEKRLKLLQRYNENVDYDPPLGDARFKAEEEFLSQGEETILHDLDEVLNEGGLDSIYSPYYRQKCLEYAYEREKLQHELDQLKKDSDKKDSFYGYVSVLVAIWLIFIAFLVVFDSLDDAELGFFFDIESNVLIALVTSTTASVVGLFLIVGRSLFPNSHKGASK